MPELSTNLKSDYMKTQAIERIRDYCTEVTQAQWEELVKVADEVGLECVIGRESLKGMTPDKFARYNNLAGVLGVYDRFIHHEPIPFSEFLAKLRGWDGEGDPFTSAETLAMASKPWQPKAGELVEGSYNGENFTDPIEFIAYRGGHYWAWENDEAKRFRFIRPIRPILTRAEAEAKLNCIIKG